MPRSSFRCPADLRRPQTRRCSQRSASGRHRRQANSAAQSHPREPSGSRCLDIGAHALLLPMVDGPEQATVAVAATRYPPEGTRGVGSALARASGWGQDTEHLSTANNRTFVIAQIESPQAVASIDDIAAVDGLDAIFIGLSGLAATMGHLGEPTHVDVLAAFRYVAQRAHRAGKPVGTLAGSEQLAKIARVAGCQFIAVGTDVGLLTRGARSS
ncbi:HpcH/HpaI aldolase/citrate lyase family protein [Streptomyces sp. NBC_00893]|uniref:HpcH/HpaI aldolase family protein n=1 Tax=Streptomyces sp. NBC_00893 TaxID=2975862 RepID=UPI00225077B7|nr:aldolase/citrate lyase family protein [Streptomyces sp. NBC_00893]MCX4850333.1 aldolase/citrate lyase family protein [Streptomyces sp. NBC_00893]